MGTQALVPGVGRSGYWYRSKYPLPYPGSGTAGKLPPLLVASPRRPNVCLDVIDDRMVLHDNGGADGSTLVYTSGVPISRDDAQHPYRMSSSMLTAHMVLIMVLVWRLLHRRPCRACPRCPATWAAGAEEA